MPVHTSHISLREAGFSKGDVLPLFTLGPGASGASSTTSTSFANATEVLDAGVVWDDIATGEMVVSLSQAARTPGTDETATVRAFNRTNMDPITGTEIEYTGGGADWSGWTAYEPPTTSSPIRIIGQIKTDPGTNSSNTEELQLVFGVRL